jgi:predicted ATPase
MNDYVYLNNYRGFSEASIPLGTVNFLVGENSTGKTSFLELLEIFFSPQFWIFDPICNGGGLKRRHFLDLVSVSSLDKTKFDIGVLQLTDDKSSGSATLVTYKNQDGQPIVSKFTRVNDGVARSLVISNWRGGKKIKFRTGPISNGSDFFTKCIDFHKNEIGFKTVDVEPELLAAPFLFRYGKFLFPDQEGENSLKVLVPSAFSKKIVSLAPIRTKPRRTYDEPQTGYSPEGEHTPYVIRKRLHNKSQAVAFKDFLERAGESSGLFKSIRVREFGRGAVAPFELDVVLGDKALGIDNVGYGVSQALPVMVEMFIRPRDTAFSIQQPEVHLHPRAQAMVGDFVAEMARLDEKSFYIETHSDFTIDRFCLNLKKNGGGDIKGQVLYFERTRDGNKVTPIEIGKSGEFISDVPTSYREFFLQEQLDILS